MLVDGSACRGLTQLWRPALPGTRQPGHHQHGDRRPQEQRSPDAKRRHEHRAESSGAGGHQGPGAGVAQAAAGRPGATALGAGRSGRCHGPAGRDRGRSSRRTKRSAWRRCGPSANWAAWRSLPLLAERAAASQRRRAESGARGPLPAARAGSGCGDSQGSSLGGPRGQSGVDRCHWRAQHRRVDRDAAHRPARTRTARSGWSRSGS